MEPQVDVVKREVEVAKETMELGDSFVGIAEAIKLALADGWQPSQDLTPIIMTSVSQLAVGMQGYEKIAVEASSGMPFTNAISLTVGKLIAIFKK